MKVDLERLRRSLARYVHAEENAVPVAVGDLEALVAVVDAARNGVLALSEGAYSDIDVGSLEAALEPFGPERPDRAWEEVDRWNAERDLAVKAAVDATPKPTHSGWALLREQDCEPLSREERREWTRDYVALVGEVVQRQFRSDQERIAELERERDALETELVCRQDNNFLEERIAELETERDEFIASAHIDCQKRLAAEARLARVPMLVKALRGLVYVDDGGPTRLRPAARRVRPPELRRAMDALAEWEKP